MPDNDEGKGTDWASIPMNSQASDLLTREFIPGYKELQERARSTPLTVLVWGPGSASDELYTKRLQVRGQLRLWGHAAVFSEEIDTLAPAPDLSTKARELLQAKKADFIIVLQGSPGSTAEVHDFAAFLEIGSKMLVFIKETAVHGYSFQGTLAELKTLYNNVETFSPDDIEKCYLLAAVRKRVEVLQLIKYRKNFE